MIHILAILQYTQTHLLGILLAIIASFAVGFAWHGPLFGKQWMAYNNMKMPQPGEFRFRMMLPGMIANVIMVFLQSAVLGRTFQIVELQNFLQALLIAVIIWLPFTALAIVNMYAWEGKKFGHMCLDVGYYLVSTLVVAAVIYSTL